MISRDGIARTYAVIRPHLRRTPLIETDGADWGLGRFQAVFKLEMLQRAGSFKTRGAFANLLLREVPPAGVAAASGGNHGAAVAYAARHLERPARIFVPTIASPAKIARIRECGAELTTLAASGNGLASPLWRQMLADVLNRPLVRGVDEYASERAGVGAAMIAGIGAGVFKGYEDTRSLAPAFDAVTSPDPDRAGLYELHYKRFADLYPRLKNWF